MAIDIKYSPAERKSFELVSETCPVVERAIDEAFKPFSFNTGEVGEILSKYGIVADRNLCHALEEVVGRTLFKRKKKLEDVVFYQGTYKLRAALVDLVATTFGLSNDRNRFSEWIEEKNKRNLYGN